MITASATNNYIDFDLDPKIFAEVEKLAGKDETLLIASKDETLLDR